MLQDKVVLVTGAGGGIGRDFALAMVAAGALTELAGPRWTYVVAAALLGAGGFAALVLSRGIASEAELAREQAA